MAELGSSEMNVEELQVLGTEKGTPNPSIVVEPKTHAGTRQSLAIPRTPSPSPVTLTMSENRKQEKDFTKEVDELLQNTKALAEVSCDICLTRSLLNPDTPSRATCRRL